MRRYANRDTLAQWSKAIYFINTITATLHNHYWNEQLREWQLDISSGQLNKIIVEGKEKYHQEKIAQKAGNLCSLTQENQASIA